MLNDVFSVIRERTLVLTGDINETSVRPVIEAIQKANDQDRAIHSLTPGWQAIPITITMNSGGGYLYSAFGLADLMIASPTPIKTIATGLVGSAALLIYVAGHDRVITPSSVAMYHAGWWGAFGTVHKVDETAKEFHKMERRYDTILLERTKLKAEKLAKVVRENRDWYLSAEQAVKHGIAHRIGTV